ncbi:uncharacterized protein LOC134722688 [Mytilus trossulus]|uniref:uncharacterized protein LOC134722688 n=1 Tax=Mytilus trossulus TaxID=6551 RepID=UPI003005404D
MAHSRSARKAQIPISCQFCEDGNTIQWKCVDCRLLICEKCKDKIHLKIRNTKHHKIIHVTEVEKCTEEFDYKHIHCQIHFEQYCCLFCKKCDDLVCPTCVSEAHKKHDFTEIGEVYKRNIEKLRIRQNKSRKFISKMTARNKELSELKCSENSKYTTVRNNIIAHQKALKNAVDQYIKELYYELDQSYKAICQSIETDITAISTSIEKANHKLNEIENFIAKSEVGDFFENFKIVGEYAEIEQPKVKAIYQSMPDFIPGEIMKYRYNFGILQHNENSSGKIALRMNVDEKYQTEMSRIDYISALRNDSIWISCNEDNIIQRAKPERNNLNIKATFSVKVFSIAVTALNEVFLVTDGTRIQNMNSRTGNLSNSIYNVAPLEPILIHVTCDNKVIVGAKNGHTKAIIVMSEKGERENVFEYDKNIKPLFTYPRSITSTRRGDMHVLDYDIDKNRGRVIVLRQGGDIYKYCGHPYVNKNIPFKPISIVATPKSNVLVVDWYTHYIHVLNTCGNLVTIFNTRDTGILHPCSLAITQAGQMYVGCDSNKAKPTEKANIYLVNLSGC